MANSTKCLLCREKPYRKLSVGTTNHYFCAFHAGLIQALEELFKEHHAHWSEVK